MSETTSPSARLKAAAPAGAAALGVVAAVVGATLLTRDPDARAPEASFSPAAVMSSAPPSAAPDVPGPPTQSGPPPEAGPPLAAPAFNQAPGAGRPQLGVEIVVKFKDDKKVQDIVDTFWKDQPAARKKFETFRQGRPEFAGLRLDRVTYSNELVLAPDAGASAAALRDIAAKIGKASDISYAEPNAVARPGGQ